MMIVLCVGYLMPILGGLSASYIFSRINVIVFYCVVNACN